MLEATVGSNWLAQAVWVAAAATLVLWGAALAARALQRRAAAERHLVWASAVAVVLALPLLGAVLPAGVTPGSGAVASLIEGLVAGESPAARGQASLPAEVEPGLSGAGGESRWGFRTGSTPGIGMSWGADGAPDPRSGAGGPPAGRPGSDADARPDPAAASGSSAGPLATPLAALWLAGFLVVALRAGMGLWAVRRLLGGARPLSPSPLRRQAEETAAGLGIRRPIRLLEGRPEAVPLAFGLLRSGLLLPSAAHHWSPARRRAVLLHELGHIRRRDVAIQLAARLACALYWWHPLAWTAARRLRDEAEQACDDVVLLAGVRRCDYADALLRTVRRGSSPGAIGLVAMPMARSSGLSGRIRAILDDRRRLAGPGAVRIGAAGLTSLALATTLAAMAPPASGTEAEVLAPGVPVAIAERPRVTLGVDDGDPPQEFGLVRTPFLLADGRVVVPNGSDNTIRIFDRDGRFLESLGALGEGAAQLTGLMSAWARGDTIEVAGPRSRVVRFHPDGEVEVVELDVPADVNLEPLIGPVGHGWGALRITSASLLPEARDGLAVERFERDGSMGPRVGDTEGMDRRRSMFAISGPEPLSPKVQVAAVGGHLYLGDPLIPEIRVLDASGELERTIGWDVEEPLSREQALARVARAGAEDPDRVSDHVDDLELWLQEAAEPGAVPLFSDFLVDDLGFVWVRPYDPARDARALGGPVGLGRVGPGGEWRVFSPEGEEVSTVEVPTELWPQHIAEDAVVGLAPTDRGLRRVRVHALERER